MGALGCSLAGPFVLICWVILAIVILVVVAIVVAAALIGSAIGSQAGKAAAGGSSAPQVNGINLGPGDLVSVVGNLVIAAAALSANALWFTGWIPNANGTTVTDQTATNHNGTTVLGTSNGAPPFCFTDADNGIPDGMDVCVVQ
jgi:ABC-type amino acid transport substrate-binding protein